MHPAFILALAGLAVAAPRAQNIDFDVIDSKPSPSIIVPPVTVASQVVSYNPTSAVSSVAAAVATNPPSAATKRDVEKRDSSSWDCAPLPTGVSSLVPSPDTTDAFLSYASFAAIATDAPTPQGYSSAFTNLEGSVEGTTYLGYYSLDSYDTVQCQQLCDGVPACRGMNVFFERDPSIRPADACTDPTSVTLIKCSLWGAAVSSDQATNVGQWQSDFHVVITGSNGYNKLAPPPFAVNFTGPVDLDGAIFVNPTSPGGATYMGAGFYPGQPEDPSVCAAQCQSTTAYNRDHATNGVYQPCNFFNMYVLSQNNVPQGIYCSMYSQTWGMEYSTNVGQYRGSDYWSVSSSYGYSLTEQDAGTV